MFDSVKKNLKEILGIVNECPEPFREKCFELLLAKLLESSSTSEISPRGTDIHKDVSGTPSGGKKESLQEFQTAIHRNPVLSMLP
ncbi:MAG: hypothetical protein AAB014_05285 [Nitrospirota bacterium]